MENRQRVAPAHTSPSSPAPEEKTTNHESIIKQLDLIYRRLRAIKRELLKGRGKK